jgi:hypothetical protein
MSYYSNDAIIESWIGVVTKRGFIIQLSVAKLLLALLFCFVFFADIFGQGYLILKDNRKIKFDKFKIEKDYLVVNVFGEKKKQQIPGVDVVGCYYQNDNMFYYCKPILDSTLFERYQFIQKKIPGRINLYEKIITTYISPNSSGTLAHVESSSYYYIEKSDKFEVILRPRSLGRKKVENIEILKSLVSDSPEILNSIGNDYKLNSKNLVKTIKQYNLLMLEQNLFQDTLNQCEIVFFKRRNGHINKDIEVFINDVPVIAKTGDYFSIKLGHGEVRKVCFDAEGKNCELLEGIPYFKTYYEIGFEFDSDLFLKARTKEHADFYMKMIDYHNGKKGINRKSKD